MSATTERLAVGYCRVSNKGAARDGLSLEVQEAQIRDHAKRLGFRLVAVIHDPGVSAKAPLRRRRGGAEVVEILERGRATIVIVAKFDRLYRTVPDALETMGDWHARGIEAHFVSLGGRAFDTGSAIGRAWLASMATHAALERELVSERVRDVNRHKRAQGLHTGGKVKLGYRVVRGKLIEEPAEQECLRLMREMWNEGKGARPWTIYRHFLANVPHPRGSRWTYETVKRHLPGWKVGYRRERTLYPPSLRRCVMKMRARGMSLPEIGRELIRRGYEPIGERFYTGTLSKLARGTTNAPKGKRRAPR